MIAIRDTLVSEELLDKHFVCDLSACKGACCVEGESGAPLDQDELELLEEVWPKVKPYLPAEGIKAVEKQGFYVVDSDGDYVTPLVKGKHCAYTIFEKDGTAKCGIEKAWKDGKISFRKPVSCHLYPVRLKQGSPFIKVEYHTWKICKPACVCGEQLKVSVFHFLKEALVRRFGKSWYQELELVNRERQKLNPGKPLQSRDSKSSKRGFC